MGGRGSGNRYRSQKSTCESYLRIDIRYLNRKGWLKPGTLGGLSWSRNGEPSGKISFRTHTDYLVLDFKTRDYGDADWQPVVQQVRISRTPINFGGERAWLHCPRCERRCLILYGGGRFYCRTCYRLGYESQREDSWQRAITRTQRARERLGGSESIDDLFPPKPKGMHWKTYRALEAFDAWAARQWDFHIEAFLNGIRR
jgi:hypothetical protein